MFCPNCGAEYLEGQKFCMSCGFKLSTGDAAPAEAAPVEVAPVEVAPTEVAPAIPTPVVEEAPVEVAPVEPAPVAEVAPKEEPPVYTPVVEPINLDSYAPVEPAASSIPAPVANSVVTERIDLTGPQVEPTTRMAPTPSPVPASQTGSMPVSPVSPVAPVSPAAPTQEIPVAQGIPTPVDPTMVSPIPQPISEPAPTTGASNTYQQQPSFGAPPAAAYTPQAVPQAPAKKPWYASTVVKVLAGLVAFGAAASIAFRAASGLFSTGGGNSSNDDYAPIEEVIVDVKDEVDDKNSSGSSTNSTTPTNSGSGSSSTFTGSEDEYLESHGYPTLLAFMELSGKDLASLVTSNGYFFYNTDDANVYAKRDGTIVFNVLTDDGYLEESDYPNLSVGGKDESAIFIVVLEGFSSPDAVLDGVANCEIVDRKSFGAQETVAVVRSPSGREYLADIYDVEDGDYEIDLYTPEAIEMGFFDIVNDGTFGTTPTEVLNNFSL